MPKTTPPTEESFRTIEALQATPDKPVVVPLTPGNVAMVADLRRAAGKVGVFFSSQQDRDEGVLRFAVVSERRIRIRHLDYAESERAEMFPSWRPKPES
ncbi:hypothetical protein [Streptomyces sp. IMTB 1903]|uniref:hypothetical protein n=1 Tax=Streptomyces sp. IMTB 1903 TaxID=1776680 RepID=UPI0007594CE9|nr:hypothetical protein [Streptomyces sp. IMTB 1903]